MSLSRFYATVSTAGSLPSVLLRSREKDEVLEQLPIVRATNEHRSYILSTWVKSYEPTIRKLAIGPTLTRIDGRAYRTGEAKLAERLWEKALVVVSGDDSYTIHGWVCGAGEGGGHLWHVYVPPTLRRSGLGSSLTVFATGSQHYSVSKPWPQGCQPKGHVCTYDPWRN